MRKKRSIILSIILLFFLITFGLSIWRYYTASVRVYDDYIKNIYEENLQIYANLSVNFLKHDLLDDLKTRLDEGRYRNKIHFFILKKGREVIFCGNKDDACELINKDYEIFNKILVGPENFYTTVKYDNYTMTIGINASKTDIFLSRLNKEKKALVEDILLTIGILFVILLYFLKDFIKILRFFRKSSRDFSKLEGNTYEVDLFLKGLKGYEKNLESLKNRAEVLESQVLSALQSAIISGENPPYDFNCTMVLTDINNFSHIYDNYSKEEFVKIIKEFFFEGAHIISKHGGLIYKFVGDEAIYFFRDKDHENSSAIALSAVVELNDLAQKITLKYENKTKYLFSIKSAISYGTVTLDTMNNTYEIFGTNIIEASRILSEITEKDKNTIFYSDKIMKSIEEFAESNFFSTVKLKGLSEKLNLYSFKNRKSVNSFLKTISISTVNKLNYFRTNREIITILDFLSDQAEILHEKIFIEISNVLKSYIITKSDNEVKKAYFDLLQNILVKAVETKEKKFHRYLSSIISLAINIVPINDFTKENISIMKKILFINDKRIIANIVDIFIYFNVKDFTLPKNISERIFTNRVRANILVKEGLNDLNNKVLKNLKKMIKSKKPFYKASGLYALGEISAYYKNKNIVYFSTHSKLQKIILSILDFLDHENEMVRRQALKAAKKINNEEINKEIDSFYKSNKSKAFEKSIEK